MMEYGQIILGLGGIAGATVAMVKGLELAFARRKHECSAGDRFSRVEARIDRHDDLLGQLAKSFDQERATAREDRLAFSQAVQKLSETVHMILGRLKANEN